MCARLGQIFLDELLFIIDNADKTEGKGAEFRSDEQRLWIVVADAANRGRGFHFFKDGFKACAKRGIFNMKLFKKFHILTSLDIQEVYLQALDGKRQISIIKEYWLTKIPDKAKFIGIDGEITEVGSLENRDKGLETEDKARNEKGFIPPTPEEVRQYFSDKGYSEEAANKAYDYYSAGNWKDSKGKRVKNWKQKMIAVWFKAENLKTIENGNKEGRIDF